MQIQLGHIDMPIGFGREELKANLAAIYAGHHQSSRKVAATLSTYFNRLSAALPAGGNQSAAAGYAAALEHIAFSAEGGAFLQ